jgi:nitrile hydratase
MKARYAVGQRVAIVDRVHSGHMRTPHYVRGKVGEVVRIVGPMLNPEQLAYGYSGVPGKMLYRVRLRQRDLWPEYPVGERDTLEIEIYEHWLEEARDQKP